MGHMKPGMSFIASSRKKNQAAIDYDIVGSITLFHDLFVLFLFLVCIQLLQYLLVLAQIGTLVSWSDYLMTYVNRLMDHGGGILYSVE